MGFSKPSVSRAVGRLKNDNYIVIDDNGYITLTKDGLFIARNEQITRLPSKQKTACFSIPVIPILLLCKLHIVNYDLCDVVCVGKTVEECGKAMI